ncbi:MAG TPA: response regulator transcription factor [Rhodospirillales bacterium]|nr:response regulator transcription factor [Rhodospirillales bacterium]
MRTEPTPSGPSVFIVDDDEKVRNCLSELFSSVKIPFHLFSSGRDFIKTYQKDQPGCIIVEMRLPGMSGFDLQQEMMARAFDIPVIFLTDHGDVDTSVRAMKAGAHDFIQKPFNEQLLLEAVEKAIARSIENSKTNAKYLETQKRLSLLSKREREVLDLIVVGEPNKKMAEKLGLSIKTIEFHRANIMKKVKAKSLVQLIIKTLLMERY